MSHDGKMTNSVHTQFSYDVKLPIPTRIGYISQSHDRNNVMTVKNGATAAGSEVWFEPLVYKRSQEWKVNRNTGSKYFTLKNPSSNKILVAFNNKITIESK